MIIIGAKGTHYSDNLIKSIKKYTPDEEYRVVEEGRTCISSYVKGFEKDGEYMFMHDSMEVKDKDWLNRFREKDTGGIVAHSIFPFDYDNPAQREFIDLPDGDVGVFGPIFYTKKFNLIKPFMEDRIPTDINQMRAWERGLGCVCKLLGLPIESVYGEFNYEDVFNDRLDGLKKIFLLR